MSYWSSPNSWRSRSTSAALTWRPRVRLMAGSEPGRIRNEKNPSTTTMARLTRAPPALTAMYRGSVDPRGPDSSGPAASPGVSIPASSRARASLPGAMLIASLASAGSLAVGRGGAATHTQQDDRADHNDDGDAEQPD